MLQLLNRFAWGLSWTLAFLVIFFLGIFTNIIDDWGGFDSETFLVWLILVWVTSLIIKKIFLSKAYIARVLDERGRQVEQGAEKEEAVLVSEDGLKQVQRKEKIDNIAKPVEGALAKLAGGVRSESVSEEVEDNLIDTEDALFEETTESETVANKEFDFGNRDSQEENIFEEKTKKDTEPNIIQAFFQENALAKIGGILLFLSVVFLLQLVYTHIGPIGKLMIGFAFGFAVFVVGLVLDKKEHKKEAKILFGVSILINYLVILSGRYLIGEGMFVKQTILNEGITFFLLAVNTIFAVSVAMAYESKALLFFSFVVAYVNPFLLGEKISLTIYTMLAYSLLVSLGGVFLSIYYSKRSLNLANSFLDISFIGGNILVLFAPFDFAWQWVLKLAVLVLLSIIGIFYSYKNKNNQAITLYFIGAYIFFVLLILYGSFELGVAFSGLTSTFAILVFFTTMLFGSIFFFFNFAITSLFYLSLLPLLIILALFQIDVLPVGELVYILVGTMMLYLLIFSSVLEKIKEKMSYVFFSALALFVLFMSMIWNSLPHLTIGTTSSIQNFGIIVSIFMFLFSAFYFSRRKGLEQLYSLSSLSTVFILYTVIERSGNLRVISIISIVIFMLINILWPLVNKQLMIRNTSNLVFGMVVGALFAVSELFYFWYGSTNQSAMQLGLSFVGLAIVYFFVSYAMYKILDHHNQELGSDSEKVSVQDTVYFVIGISISIFSLAVVYVFSKHSEIISAILLFESALLFYFYSRKQNFKIYLAGIILMFVGVSHLFRIIGSIETREYLILVSMFIIFLSFALSLKFLSFEKKRLRVFHDIAHVLGMIAIAGVIFMIVPYHSRGYLIFAYSLFTLLLSFLYGSVFSAQIKNIYIAILGILFLSQIMSIESVFFRLDRSTLEIFKVLQYLSTVVFFVSVVIFNYVSRAIAAKDIIKRQIVFIFNFIFSVYLFVITTQYVYFFFNKIEFVITIYWGILALIFLTYGIQRDFIKIRTIGLYILSLAVLKILVFDIWAGLDDAIMRVIALMLVGGIMISVSVLYGRKYGGDLKGEFNFGNLTSKKEKLID